MLYILAMRVPRIAYVYIHGVGILFLHSSSHKAFGDAPVHGRKTTSLTSFLFLYHLLIAIVRRLVVAETHYYGKKGTFGL